MSGLGSDQVMTGKKQNKTCVNHFFLLIVIINTINNYEVNCLSLNDFQDIARVIIFFGYGPVLCDLFETLIPFNN